MWPALLVWLRESLPEILHLLSMGQLRRKGTLELEQDIEANKKTVEDQNLGKSDVDIVDDAISEMRRIKEHDNNKG